MHPLRSGTPRCYVPFSGKLFGGTNFALFTHTGEWVRSVYGADGHYIREAVKDINWVLRDHHSGDVCPMNAGLLDLLQLLRTQLDCQDPFLVVSGYRSAATNAWMHAHGRGVASKSFHIKGMAIDLRCEARDLSQVHRAAISLRAGSVGFTRSRTLYLLTAARSGTGKGCCKQPHNSQSMRITTKAGSGTR